MANIIRSRSRGRVDAEVAAIQRESPEPLPERVAEQIARVHVREERDLESAKEQDHIARELKDQEHRGRNVVMEPGYLGRALEQIPDRFKSGR